MARMVFRALLDYVNNKKWSNGHIPRTKRDRKCKDLYEQADIWIHGRKIDVPPPPLDIENDFIPESEARLILETFERLMSFDSACGILGWDPDWVRKMLPGLTPEQLRRVGKRYGLT
jgi:hypothetical protein